ncbi:hypothetical protein [Microcystis phage Mvi-JY20]|uniref:Tail fiber protein n=1 Tax=Microcystis phage Mvi-JY20 TaxID=3128146 RepID=A0AAX4QHN6_9CAUD
MIRTLDELQDALANNASRILINKASIANQTATRFASLWRATGQPAQAAIPGTTPAVCTTSLLGAIQFTQQTAPITSYIGYLALASSVTGQGVEIHDRLAHMGGLVLNVTTPQTITGLDLNTLIISADRRGEANFSDIQWWLEVYADGGATASNATINVTYHDGSTGNLTALAVGGTLRAGNLFALTPLIPAADQGKYIRAINSVTLSASTTVAGNFGFTATRVRTSVVTDVANKQAVYTWDFLGIPEVPNDSCLFALMQCQTTATGTVLGTGKIAHG